MKKKKDIIKNPKICRGRPQLYDRVDIFNQLEKWLKKDDSINLLGFCVFIGISSKRLSEWALDDKDLSERLQKAKDVLGEKREKKLSDGTLHGKAYDLNASTYDYFLKQAKRDQMKFESELKKQEIKETLNASDIVEKAKRGDYTQK